MGVRELIDKIKNIIKGNRTKQLPAGNENIKNTEIPNESREDFINNLKVPQPIHQQYERGTLDLAIQQYMYSLLADYEEYGEVNAYHSLVHLWVPEKIKNPGNNRQNEKDLLMSLVENPNYSISPQTGEDGKPGFFHIKSSNFREDNLKNAKDIVRLYLLVERSNIAELSREMIQEFGNNEFYFKFNADNQYEEDSARSESIVMYTSKDQLDNHLRIIDKIKKTKPMLFPKMTMAGNPFLKSIYQDDDTVKYAPEVTRDYYDMYGGKKQITPSFNSKLSVALAEAITASINQMTLQNKGDKLSNIERSRMMEDIQFTFSEDGSFRRKLNDLLSGSMQYVSELDEHELIQNIKGNLLNAISRNPELDINTRSSTIKDFNSSKEYEER